MTSHSSRRVINTLAASRYEESEDRSAAFYITKDIISRARKKPPLQMEERIQMPQSSSYAAPTPSMDKIAQNVAMRFKDSGMKFHGNEGECWQEYVDEYRPVARDYGLKQRQKFDYLHNLFSGCSISW